LGLGADVVDALEQDKPIIPVFVSGAKTPAESDLPDDVSPIVFPHGVKLRPDPDFNNDVERLIRGIEQS